jgi:hypothetical protein
MANLRAMSLPFHAIRDSSPSGSLPNMKVNTPNIPSALQKLIKKLNESFEFSLFGFQLRIGYP